MGSGLVVELWVPVYRWNLVRSQLSRISEDVPEIQGLRASEQVARRERFHRVEDHVRELDRAEVIARIHRTPEELPDGINRGPRSEFTEMGLICNEAVKQKRHRPLRHLFQDAGNALRGPEALLDDVAIDSGIAGPKGGHRAVRPCDRR